LNRKITTDSRSICTTLLALRNLGNERYLSGDYNGSIEAFSRAWAKYEGDRMPRSPEIDNLMT
jgi:hypothetical protein